MIKTIIFDLSEVLIAGLIGVEKELAPLVNLSEQDFLEGLWTDSFWDLMKGKISEDEYLLDVLNKNNWNVGINVFKEVFRNNFHKEVDGMISLAENLSRDYKLILLSDHAVEWVAYIEKIHPFLKLFQKTYYSFQSGEIKKEKRAFELLLKENNLNAGECLFIDDSPANIIAAEEVGLKGIRFEGMTKLKTDLREFIYQC